MDETLALLAHLSGENATRWPLLRQSYRNAESERLKIDRIAGQISGGIGSTDLSIVVFGSLARGEWTPGSDVDWTLLVDGMAAPEHSQAAHEFREKLEVEKYIPPGKTGVFGGLTFSHDMIHRIGGSEDTNRNLTRRLLLLLESRPIGESAAHSRTILGILNRYLQNDLRPHRLKVPRFLLNDIHRFWLTMCVDYANKFHEQAGEKWAIRVVKLRFSRKLIFAAGRLMCFACDPGLFGRWTAKREGEPAATEVVAFLSQFVHSTPWEIVLNSLVKYGREELAEELLEPYEAFLQVLTNPEQRRHLETLPKGEVTTDPLFRNLIEQSERFNDALVKLLVRTDPLRPLSEKYGAF